MERSARNKGMGLALKATENVLLRACTRFAFYDPGMLISLLSGPDQSCFGFSQGCFGLVSQGCFGLAFFPDHGGGPNRP